MSRTLRCYATNALPLFCMWYDGVPSPRNVLVVVQGLARSHKAPICLDKISKERSLRVMAHHN